MDLSDATGKIPATPGIDPGTFRQCLNHYATPGLLTLNKGVKLLGTPIQQAKLFLCTSRRHLEGADALLHRFLTLALDGGEW